MEVVKKVLSQVEDCVSVDALAVKIARETGADPDDIVKQIAEQLEKYWYRNMGGNVMCKVSGLPLVVPIPKMSERELIEALMLASLSLGFFTMLLAFADALRGANKRKI